LRLPVVVLLGTGILYGSTRVYVGSRQVGRGSQGAPVPALWARVEENALTRGYPVVFPRRGKTTTALMWTFNEPVCGRAGDVERPVRLVGICLALAEPEDSRPPAKQIPSPTINEHPPLALLSRLGPPHTVITTSKQSTIGTARKGLFPDKP